jgi:hypothetical protein
VSKYVCPTKKLHNQDLQNSYSSPNITGIVKFRGMIWVGKYYEWQDEIHTKLLLLNLMERGLPVVRRTWDVNIETYLEDIRCEGKNCILLTQDNVQWRAHFNTVMNIQVPCVTGICYYLSFKHLLKKDMSHGVKGTCHVFWPPHKNNNRTMQSQIRIQFTQIIA